MYINGFYTQNGYVFANETGMLDVLKDSLLDVKSESNTLFNLVCGESNKNCAGSFRYNCQGNGLCVCNGQFKSQHGGCVNVNYYMQSMF